MKKLMMVVAGLVLGACMTAQAGFRTETTVTPGTEAHQYVVQFKITDVAKDGKTDVLSTPKVTLKAGQESKITVADEKEQNGVFCTALVKEIEGGIEAVTTVVVKEKGTEKLSTTSASEVATKDSARNGTHTSPYKGTVAIFYTSAFQQTSRDWDSIKEYGGPDHPMLGYYSYKEKDDVLKHLKWIRRAGVDAIVYDCYGFAEWGPLDIKKDRVLKWIMEALENQEKETRKLKLIIYIEKYDGNASLKEYNFVLDYVREHIANRPYYFRLQNKPMVLTYMNGAKTEALAQLEKETSDFTLRRIRAYDGKANWSYVNPWPQPSNHEWMSVSPGIDPFMELAYLGKKKGYPLDVSKWNRFDRQGGEYFRKQLLTAREVNPDFIFISGWNDWQYGNQIEPAVEYRFKYVDQAAQMLGREEETKPYRDEQ